MSHYDKIISESVEKERKEMLEEINKILADEEYFFVSAALKIVKNLRAIISAANIFQQIIVRK